MKAKLLSAAVLFASLPLWAIGAMLANDQAANSSEVHQPHTPTLIFYLSEADSQKDADAIRASVQKLKSVATISVNTNRSYVRVRFDSHVVSYHQVAQAISDAGTASDKRYNPRLIFSVSEYAQINNAAKVDAIFAGKRLNTRVTVKPLDKSKGRFLVFFQPLKIEKTVTDPQGFNGGHLHHPISDPPAQGLGLTSTYAADDDLSIPVDPK